MRKMSYIGMILLLLSCQSEEANDCFQTAGAIVQQDFVLAPFDKIEVNRDIELILKEGLEQHITIETGAHLINDVEALVTDGKLILTDHNTCNYVRDYGMTKVYITAPNITEIRSSTQYDIRSDGVLTYPNLTILSEDFYAPDSFTIGNFYLQLNNDVFNVLFNNLSNAFVSGTTNHLNITLAAGTSRFEGADLIAQHATIWNRSSNDMMVNPQQSITGTISGTGDVICLNRPITVDVLEQYKGRLIFK